MKASNENINLKIFRAIFAIVNLLLISGGLVSCVVQAPKPVTPTEQQKSTLEPKQSDSNHKDDDDKEDDSKDDKEHDDKD